MAPRLTLVNTWVFRLLRGQQSELVYGSGAGFSQAWPRPHTARPSVYVGVCVGGKLCPTGRLISLSGIALKTLQLPLIAGKRLEAGSESESDAESKSQWESVNRIKCRQTDRQSLALIAATRRIRNAAVLLLQINKSLSRLKNRQIN